MAPDSPDSAIGADQNRSANNAEESPAVHGFFAPGAIGLKHLVCFIRNQGDGELVLVPKRFLRLGRVGGNTEHGGPIFGEGARKPGEVDGFPGAAWRVGTW